MRTHIMLWFTLRMLNFEKYIPTLSQITSQEYNMCTLSQCAHVRDTGDTLYAYAK